MKRIKKLFKMADKKRGGYLTIELTMVFSVLFFSLLLILFMGMVLYQEVKLQSLAVRASERGSVVYSSRVSDMTTGVKTLEDYKYRDPYRNVPLINTLNDDDYRDLVNKYVSANLGKRDILSGTNENGGDYTKIENYVFAKRLKVNIQTGYRMPVDSIGTMFGYSGPFEVNTTAVSAVVDSPDFVQNVDLVMDMVKQTDVFTSIEDGYENIMEAIDKLKDKLKK